MNSLDVELQNLQKPIPNGVDLDWLTSGCTFYQSDTVNPNAQASDLMSQLIFNRVVTKRASCELMPEERAVGQTVIAHINAGYQGPSLDAALLGVFGREVFQRHAAFIQDVKVIAASHSQLPGALEPNVGVNLASPSNGQSDREALRRHAVRMSSNALEAYRSSETPMENGSVQIGESEMSVDLANTHKSASVELSEGDIEQIKLAAMSLVGAQDDIGLTEQQDRVASDMVSEEDVKSLRYVNENDLLMAGSDELDMVFANGPVSLGDGSFGLNSENALIGCDEELADIAGVPPADLSVDDLNGGYDPNNCPSDEEDDGSMKIELQEKSMDDDLKIGMSDEFEIEI